jgi:hypothetical protein
MVNKVSFRLGLVVRRIVGEAMVHSFMPSLAQANSAGGPKYGLVWVGSIF